MKKRNIPVLEAGEGSSEQATSIISDQSGSVPDFSPRLYGITLLLAVFIVSGAWLVQRFTQIDKERDVQAWQEKLNLIAESRTADINHWVASHFKELRSLAANPSLQLYMTELQSDPAQLGAIAQQDSAQKSYLRNLLVFTAERGGYARINSRSSSIAANAQEESKSGLAIFSKDGQIVVSTLMQDSLKEVMREQAEHLKSGEEGFIDVRKDKDGYIYVGFAVPVYSIQGDQGADGQMGLVVGIKQLDDNLFSLLKHPGLTEKTLETILLRQNDDGVDYISPLQNGTSAMTRVAKDFKESATSEVKLVGQQGLFEADGVDYRGKRVLATVRQVVGAPWSLVVKVDKDEAFVSSAERRASMVAVFALIIVVVVLTLLAMWRYLQSQRSMMMSRHFRHLAEDAMAKEKLLRVVSDNQQDALYIIDAGQKCHFANQKAASQMQMATDSVAGKTLADMQGAVRAGVVAEQSATALSMHGVVYDMQRHSDQSGEHVLRSSYIPLPHIPVVGLEYPTPGVLVVEQDVSEVVREREARLRIQSQLVSTLVNLVDKRDPFSANHSLLVSELARSVAISMELDSVSVETTSLAGSLMNIGKILVPTELLTKAGELSADEKKSIQDSMNMAGDLVSAVPFDGPVADTLRQWQEHWDGSGLKQLKGDAILASARVIAVVNAFIGMISPRSWRNAMSIDEAGKQLLQKSDTYFDRRVVVALMHYLDTQSGKTWLAKLQARKTV